MFYNFVLLQCCSILLKHFVMLYRVVLKAVNHIIFRTPSINKFISDNYNSITILIYLINYIT